LELVEQLDGKTFEPNDVNGPFEYYKTEPMVLKGKTDRLIWLLKEGSLFIGVVNAHRRD
jgi:hypothetical protein